MAHLSQADRLAAGLHALPDSTEPFAATQAAWRFFANPRIDLPQLAQPLIEAARSAIPRTCDQWTLVILDWSLLHFGGHGSKADRVTLAHRRDLGYELLTALAVSDRDGHPLAPLCLELRAADGLHTTRCVTPAHTLSPLDGLDPVMKHVESLSLARPSVYIIDREADSCRHLREWHRAGRHVLVRANETRRVLHQGREMTMCDVASTLALKVERQITVQGAPATQSVGETRVVLHRAARENRIVDGQRCRREIPGEALEMRLIVSEIRANDDRVIGRWLLLTNVPTHVGAATLALWYYYRWRIESYHKLLKGAGQQVESWLQDDAAAMARRLCVVAMATLLVWNLARETSPQADELRKLLVRLSGRQMKRGPGQRGFTEPALLAGLGVLIPMLCLLQHHDLENLKCLARQTSAFNAFPIKSG